MSSRPSQTSIKRRRPLPTTARGPRLGALASLALHGAVVAAMVVVFQHNTGLSEESHAVPVDLVTITSQTNVAAAAPTPPPPAPEPPKPEEMTPPPMPDVAQAEPAPDIPPPKIQVEEPKKQDDMAALLNKLAGPVPTSKATKVATTANQSAGLASAMTSTLKDAFLSQIRNCWNPIPGAPNPADQIVQFDLKLNRDGTVASLRLLEVSATPYGAAAAQAGSRAIYQCQPYRLPPERYGEWQEINPLRFDPRQMMQQ
jgi:outer membrane biosynthesis protein TonB